MLKKIKKNKSNKPNGLIEKFRAKASKASMAQSLIKKIDKIERIQVDQDDNSVMKLRFPVSVRPGKVVAGDRKFIKKLRLKSCSLLILIYLLRGRAKLPLWGKMDRVNPLWQN